MTAKNGVFRPPRAVDKKVPRYFLVPFEQLPMEAAGGGREAWLASLDKGPFAILTPPF